MIEQIMIFGLGFLLAGLLALAFTPVFWNRALRLTRRRLERQMPLSPQEILADRDFIRAEAALLQRRMEQKLETANQAHIADMVEIGRREWRITTLANELALQSGLAHERLNEIGRLNQSLEEAATETAGLERRFETIRFLCEEQASALQALQEEKELLTRQKTDKTLALSNCLNALAQLHEEHRSLRDLYEADGEKLQNLESSLAETRAKEGQILEQQVLLRQDIKDLGASVVRIVKEKPAVLSGERDRPAR